MQVAILAAKLNILIMSGQLISEVKKKKTFWALEFTLQKLLWDFNLQKWRLNKMKCYTVNKDQGIQLSLGWDKFVPLETELWHVTIFPGSVRQCTQSDHLPLKRRGNAKAWKARGWQYPQILCIQMYLRNVFCFILDFKANLITQAPAI